MRHGPFRVRVPSPSISIAHEFAQRRHHAHLHLGSASCPYFECTPQVSTALEVGDGRTTCPHEFIRRDGEHVVPRAGRSPHEIVNTVVLQQIRVNKNSQLGCVTKGRHAKVGLGNSTVSKCASTNGWRQSSQPWQQFGFANPHDGTWYLKCGDDGGSNIHRRHLFRLLPAPGRHRSVN